MATEDTITELRRAHEIVGWKVDRCTRELNEGKTRSTKELEKWEGVQAGLSDLIVDMGGVAP